MVDDQDRCEWVNVFSGTGSLGSARQRAVKWLYLPKMTGPVKSMVDYTNV